jgi:hypothetical protein
VPQATTSPPSQDEMEEKKISATARTNTHRDEEHLHKRTPTKKKKNQEKFAYRPSPHGNANLAKVHMRWDS